MCEREDMAGTAVAQDSKSYTAVLHRRFCGNTNCTSVGAGSVPVHVLRKYLYLYRYTGIIRYIHVCP